MLLREAFLIVFRFFTKLNIKFENSVQFQIVIEEIDFLKSLL